MALEFHNLGTYDPSKYNARKNKIVASPLAPGHLGKLSDRWETEAKRMSNFYPPSSNFNKTVDEKEEEEAEGGDMWKSETSLRYTAPISSAKASNAAAGFDGHDENLLHISELSLDHTLLPSRDGKNNVHAVSADLVTTNPATMPSARPDSPILNAFKLWASSPVKLGKRIVDVDTASMRGDSSRMKDSLKWGTLDSFDAMSTEFDESVTAKKVIKEDWFISKRREKSSKLVTNKGLVHRITSSKWKDGNLFAPYAYENVDDRNFTGSTTGSHKPGKARPKSVRIVHPPPFYLDSKRLGSSIYQTDSASNNSKTFVMKETVHSKSTDAKSKATAAATASVDKPIHNSVDRNEVSYVGFGTASRSKWDGDVSLAAKVEERAKRLSPESVSDPVAPYAVAMKAINTGLDALFHETPGSHELELNSLTSAPASNKNRSTREVGKENLTVAHQPLKPGKRQPKLGKHEVARKKPTTVDDSKSVTVSTKSVGTEVGTRKEDGVYILDDGKAKLFSSESRQLTSRSEGASIPIQPLSAVRKQPRSTATVTISKAADETSAKHSKRIKAITKNSKLVGGKAIGESKGESHADRGKKGVAASKKRNKPGKKRNDGAALKNNIKNKENGLKNEVELISVDGVEKLPTSFSSLGILLSDTVTEVPSSVSDIQLSSRPVSDDLRVVSAPKDGSKIPVTYLNPKHFKYLPPDWTKTITPAGTKSKPSDSIKLIMSMFE